VRRCRARWPLDEQHRSIAEQIANSQRLHFPRAAQAIQIDVIELQPCRLVRLDQGVSRTANRADDAEAGENSSDECGLARTELPFEADDERAAAGSAQSIAQRASQHAHVVGGRDAHLR